MVDRALTWTEWCASVAEHLHGRVTAIEHDLRAATWLHPAAAASLHHRCGDLHHAATALDITAFDRIERGMRDKLAVERQWADEDHSRFLFGE